MAVILEIREGHKAMDWETEERMPRYDDIREFEVWIRGEVRRVRRIGNRSWLFSPGTLVFTDCTHPAQNVLCDETAIDGWRHAPMSECGQRGGAWL